jgi:branched-chain amino acid transport system ATP-binding protein
MMSDSTAAELAETRGDDLALELRAVRAAYGSITVLRGVDLAIPYGSLVALLGPNGGGKSTLLRVIAGQLPVTGGDVFVAGRRVNGAAPDELARRGVCLIPEGRGIFANLSVRENLWMATHGGVPLKTIEEIAYARFPQLGQRRRQLAGTLSGGEQQMLAMARALATDPALLLLDELSMGLAPIVVEQLYEIVAQIAKGGGLDRRGRTVCTNDSGHRRPGRDHAPWTHLHLRDPGRRGTRVVDRIPRRMRLTP